MALHDADIEKIKAAVYQRPRNVAELATILGKNWRTVNNYVAEIEAKTGLIRTHTFREGSRGALKIVFWNNTEHIYATAVQEKIFKEIERGMDKSDFSPFEIYEYIPADKRRAYYELVEKEEGYNYDNESLIPFFKNAQKEILIFAGNLAFIHTSQLLKHMQDAVKRNVAIKILSNVNVADQANVQKVLSLNNELSQPLVEIRHTKTPLRAFIFDETIIKLCEIVESRKKEGQIKQKVAVYYEFRDPAWIAWMQNVFWKRFQESVKASFRLEHITTIERLQ